MSLIRLHDVMMAYETRTVLRDVFFRLANGERVGLIGKNGAGKTTLLNLILEQIGPVKGRVERSPGLSIGYFSQFSELDDTCSPQEILEELFADIRSFDKRLELIFGQLDLELNTDNQLLLLEQLSEIIETDHAPGRVGVSAPHRYGSDQAWLQRDTADAATFRAIGWLA